MVAGAVRNKIKVQTMAALSEGALTGSVTLSLVSSDSSSKSSKSSNRGQPKQTKPTRDGGHSKSRLTGPKAVQGRGWGRLEDEEEQGREFQSSRETKKQ